MSSAVVIVIVQLAVNLLHSVKASRNEPLLFCYYSSYSQNRADVGKFVPEDIDPDLCTHVVFAFADVIQGTQLKASGWNDLANGKDEGLYARTQALRKSNPRLKILLAIGGWRAGSEPFVAIVSTDDNRKAFASNAASFVRRHGFDGLDIDWEFPGSRGSGPEHKPLFTALLKDIRESFDAEASESGHDRLLLTMAAAGGSYYIELAYETRKIIKYVDYLLVMAYNYHGSWNQFTGHHSGLFPRSDEVAGEREWNQAWTIDFWLNKAGAPSEKLIIGISTYGTTFTLASEAQHGLKAATTGPGEPGKYTKEAGTLAYYEICDNLRHGWTSVWIDEQKVPYAYHDDQWVGYDNLDSVTYKAQYLREKGVAGAFTWSLEMDDFRGSCGTGKYPLLTAISRAMRQSSPGGGSYHVDGLVTSSNADRDDVRGRQSVSSYDDLSSRYRSQQTSTGRPPHLEHRDEISQVDDRRSTGSGNSRGRTGFSDANPSRQDVLSDEIAEDGRTSGDRRKRPPPGLDDDDEHEQRRPSLSRAVGSRTPELVVSGRRTEDGLRALTYPKQSSDDVTVDDVSRRDNRHRLRGNEEAGDDRRGAAVASSFDLNGTTRDSTSCTRAGVFVKPGTGCQSYFVCVQHGTSWHQFHMSCPRGMIFRASVGDCDERSTVNACNE